MLIKWINCEVPEHKRIAFSYAQEQWKLLSNIDGFLGQVGGWDIDRPSKAGIISFWRDLPSYQFFMDFKHDRIFNENNQKNTYDSISVEIFEKKFNCNENNVIQMLKYTKMMRIGLCIVKKDRRKHFEDMQKEIWNEGMSAHQDMLAGVFCENNQQNNLVVSLWRNKNSHQNYMDHTLPYLMKLSNVKDDVIEIQGSVLKLNETWSVL
ncbi:YdbC family protein [Fictibacillus nanhaiensis]|uniref:YdbC family protein n=1 Tax=Fictibacillus nanhaiensis TaxID=742169 RepID=UPI001C95CFE4|nr:YdbC family protein [Fictibacillus nanhaiensis]MBY6035973.1 YdbC family protein [Fictibacillus nanhaiensis]